MRFLARTARRLDVFVTALSVYTALKLAQLCGVQAPRFWDALHTWCARRLLALALGRRGLWVKCCQYVASRGDVLPAPYISVLAACLDDCPPDPPDVVDALVRAEVRAKTGRELESVFEGFDPAAPIASASIAQVHRARLTADGTEVVLKVQHPSVREFLLQDLRDLTAILDLIGVAEPEFDLRHMLSAWMKMVPAETDFLCELENVRKVRSVHASASADLASSALIPRPYAELSTSRLFVMEFVRGCKVNDFRALDAAGVDRERLVSEITRAFALQLIVAGYLHGDLHSGNILVHSLEEGGAPALLDFGVTVELDDEKRLGFARLVAAAADNDSFSLLQAFADMGVHLNRADPVASMDLINFMFRETGSRDETVSQTQRFRARMMSHRSRMAEGASSAAGIPVDQRSPSGSSSGDGMRRPLVDAYPGHLVFFMRTLACLRGLASALDVQHAYLPVLSYYARFALREACPIPERATALVWTPKHSLTPQHAPGSLYYRRARRVQARLKTVFELLEKHDLMIGMQVTVYHEHQKIVDMGAGHMGKYNPRPVKGDSLFNVFGASDALVAVLFAQMQDQYGVEYGDLLAKYWPEYAVAGKEKTTVGHLLTQATGLCGVIPGDMSMTRLRNDRRGIVRHLEKAEPVHTPGANHVRRFYDLHFGWLSCEMLERITRKRYPSLVSRLSSKLGIEDECYCGNMPDSLIPDVRTSRVATLTNSIVSDLELLTTATHASPEEPQARPRRRRGRRPASNAALAETPRERFVPHAATEARARDRDLGRWADNGSICSTVSDESREFGSDTHHDARPHDVSSVSSNEDERDGARSFTSMELARCAIESLSSGVTSDDRGEACELDDLSSLPPYLLDPAFFNHPVMRSACVPSANAHMSARALARIFAMLANDGEIDGSRILRKGRVAQMMSTLPDMSSSPDVSGPPLGRAAGQDPSRSSYGAGLRLYDVVRKSGRVQRQTAIGCSGLGGTVAFANPEFKFAIAVTVNKLNVVSAASALVIYTVCKTLGVPVPLHIHKMEKRAREVMRRENCSDIFTALKTASATDFAQALSG